VAVDQYKQHNLALAMSGDRSGITVTKYYRYLW